MDSLTMFSMKKASSLIDMTRKSEGILSEQSVTSKVKHFGIFPNEEFLICIDQGDMTDPIILPYLFPDESHEQFIRASCVPDSLKTISTKDDFIQVLENFTEPTDKHRAFYSLHDSEADCLDGTGSFGFWIRRFVFKQFKKTATRPNCLVFSAHRWPGIQFFRIS